MIFHITCVHPLKWKSDFYTTFYAFQKLAKNLLNTKIKMFKSDGSHEFDNIYLGAHFLEHGIYFWKSCLKTQAQNGVVERKHRHLNTIAQAFLIEANMPATFWIDTIQTIVFIVNELPMPNLQGHSAFEKLFLPLVQFSQDFWLCLLSKFFGMFCQYTSTKVH